MFIKKLNISPAKKCFFNIEVVRNLTKYMNYQQQYEFTQISKSSRTLITDYIWIIKMMEVEIEIYGENDFVVANKIYYSEIVYDEDHGGGIHKLGAKNAIHFNANDLDVFLSLNQNNIQTLKIKTKPLLSAEFLLKHDFKNLKYLELKYLQIDNQLLGHIADNYKTIRTLSLLQCYNISEEMMNDECLHIFETMNSLQNLHLSLSSCEFDLSDIEALTNKLKLQQLALTCFDNHNLNYYQISFGKKKDNNNFEMGNLLPRNDPLNFLSFEHLCKLCLNDKFISNDFFNILHNSCGQLTNLSLTECQMDNFVALPKLKRIYIETCTGLTYNDLKIILSDMKLEFFTCIRNFFRGDFETFSISPTLQSFKIHDVDGEYLNELFNSNSNTGLMKLKKFVCTSNFNRTNFSFPLKLNYLQTDLGLITIDDILELKHLNKIILTSYSPHQMSKLQQLLKHDKLRELSILYYNSGDLTEINNVTSNLKYFNIPWDMLETKTDFVLDLLNVNTNLSLRCAGATSNSVSSSIRRIITNERFPERFKTINVCGFSIDCASILDESIELQVLKLFQENCYIILK